MSEIIPYDERLARSNGGFITPNNEITITANGTVVVDKIKPEEISVPEGIENSENYLRVL